MTTTQVKPRLTATESPDAAVLEDIETLANVEPFRTMTDQNNVASPDVFCRTGLFGASAQRKREVLEPNQKVLVASDPATGYQVMLRGGLDCDIPGPLGEPLAGRKVSSRLDQNDFSVYLALLRLTSGVLGSNVVFEPYAFVKSLGLTDTLPNVRSTFESIARMNSTRLTVVQPKHGHTGKFVRCVGYLVSSIAYDDVTKRYSIALDPQLAGLFQKSYFNHLAWEQRLALSSALAKWLHAELNSHRSGYRRWSHLLQQSFGAQAPDRVFRVRLREAVEEVSKVTGWDIQLESNTANFNLKLVCLKPGEETIDQDDDDGTNEPDVTPAMPAAIPAPRRPAPRKHKVYYAAGSD